VAAALLPVEQQAALDVLMVHLPVAQLGLAAAADSVATEVRIIVALLMVDILILQVALAELPLQGLTPMVVLEEAPEPGTGAEVAVDTQVEPEVLVIQLAAVAVVHIMPVQIKLIPQVVRLLVMV
jgi:hypothetical protein